MLEKEEISWTERVKNEVTESRTKITFCLQ